MRLSYLRMIYAPIRTDAQIDGRGLREVPRWSPCLLLLKKRLGFTCLERSREADAKGPLGAELAVGASGGEVPDAEPGAGAFVLVRAPRAGSDAGVRAAWATDTQEWGRSSGLRWS